MIPILITLLTYLPYILLAYFGCQILTRLTSPNKSNNNKEQFSHELEQGPFDEEDQTYNLPQPSDPLATDGPIQPGTEELDRQYDESRIGLDAEIVDLDVESTLEKEKRDYEPNPSNVVEEEFTHKLLHGPFNNNLEITTSAPISLDVLKEEFAPMLAHGPFDSLETTTNAPLGME
jgi:hypothetical protein